MRHRLEVQPGDSRPGEALVQDVDVALVHRAACRSEAKLVESQMPVEQLASGHELSLVDSP
jgi:hypothetical protein